MPSKKETSKDLQKRRDRNTAMIEKLAGADPNADTQAAGHLHGLVMSGLIYGEALSASIQKMFGEFGLSSSALLFAKSVIESIQPRDAMEALLVQQALMTHARVLHLTMLANKQTEVDCLKTIHEYTDRASNTFRRQMLALAEYRRPPKGQAGFTAIKQANIAGQQIVQNQEKSEESTNKQGLGCE